MNTHTDSEVIIERRSDGISIVTLNRPNRLNALTDNMFRQLGEFQTEAANDPTLRAVILVGSGRAFCSGLDLDLVSTLPKMNTAEFMMLQERWADAVVGFSRMSVPTIAAVGGAAAGAGFSLALACDMRVASSTATFNAAFVRVGLSGGDCGSSWFLPRIVGHGRASDILFTGRFVDVEEALAIGLITEAVAEGEELDKAIELAELITRNSPFGVRMTKQILASSPHSLEAAIAVENRTQVLASKTEDMNEAFEAFRDKRKPKFSGR